jgi:small GTP-binding protein
VSNSFNEVYKATIGCEFGFKIIEVNGETIRVQLWDLAGQDRLGGISRLYCRDAHGALVISDISKPETVGKTAKWKMQVDEYVRCPDNSPIPMVLCMNKHDLVPAESVSTEQIQAVTRENGFAGGFFTSAKTGYNANEALTYLVTQILKKNAAKTVGTDNHKQAIPAGGLKLARQVSLEKKKGCCS